MRHSIEPGYRKYVTGYEFLSFARKLGNKYSKKLMNTAIKTGKDLATTSGKKLLHESAETTGDLVGNLIANKIVH